MKTLILILILALTSCAPKDAYEGAPTHEYDDVLRQFNSDLNALGYPGIDFSGLTIRKGTEADMIRGVCHHRAKRRSGFTDINLAKDLPRVDAEIVLYHEIGHCYFGLEHQDYRTYSLMISDLWGTVVSQNFKNSREDRLTLLKQLVDSAGSFPQ